MAPNAAWNSKLRLESKDFVDFISYRLPILDVSILSFSMKLKVLWSTDTKFSVFKDLNPFQSVKVQDAGSTLRVSFALSKWPHFHRAVTLW